MQIQDWIYRNKDSLTICTGLGSGVTARGGARGLMFSLGNFCWPAGKKRGKERRENGEEKNENCKREGGKFKMEGENGEKYENEHLPSPPHTFIFWNHWNLFGSTKMEISTGTKHFPQGKNWGKSDFATLKNIPVMPLGLEGGEAHYRIRWTLLGSP